MVARAGTMRERITFQERTDAPDGQGGVTSSWGDIDSVPTVYARVAPLSGAERVVAAQTDSKATHEVTIRYRSDVTSEWRVLWGSRVLYPTGPWLNVDERGVLLTAQCREDRDA